MLIFMYKYLCGDENGYLNKVIFCLRKMKKTVKVDVKSE